MSTGLVKSKCARNLGNYKKGTRFQCVCDFGARICCVSFNFFCGQARKDILAGKILAHKCEAGKKTCPTCAAVQKKVDSTFIPLNFVVWKFGCLIFLDKCQHVKYEEV